MSRRPLRIGIVRFLNTLPLVDGLEALDGVELVPHVPSRLIDALRGGDVDVALCSSIDAQREPGVVVLPAGMLGADGETLTVRLFARDRSLAHVTRVHCDTDSHTSVALLRVVLAERHGIRPELVPFDAAPGRDLGGVEALLLIGDKVVTAAPAMDDFALRLDLGEEWRLLTDLPFVFALWLARPTTPPELLQRAFAVLDRQRRANAGRIPSIVHAHAAAFGWPEDVARRYLEHHIAFAPTPERFRGLARFYALAQRHGVLPAVAPLRFDPDVPGLEDAWHDQDQDAIESVAAG